MKKILLWMVWLLACAACSGGADDPAKLTPCGAWEMPWAGRLVAFYAAAPVLPESDMKALALTEMQTLKADWNEVIIYINFDKKLAKELGSPKTLEKISKTGLGPSDLEIWSGKVMGGARLSWTRKDGNEEWKFQPPPPR